MGWCRLDVYPGEGRTGMRASGACCTAALLRAGLALACLIASPATASAQADRPAEETLLSLQERGRLIALFLQAVDRTADLLKAQGSGAPPSDRTVVLPDSAGWRVVCLKDLTKEPGMAALAAAGSRSWARPPSARTRGRWGRWA